MDWIHLAQNMNQKRINLSQNTNQWRLLVNTVMNVRVMYKKRGISCLPEWLLVSQGLCSIEIDTKYFTDMKFVLVDNFLLKIYR
jgi:hypothetical protein